MDRQILHHLFRQIICFVLGVSRLYLGKKILWIEIFLKTYRRGRRGCCVGRGGRGEYTRRGGSD